MVYIGGLSGAKIGKFVGSISSESLKMTFWDSILEI